VQFISGGNHGKMPDGIGFHQFNGFANCGIGPNGDGIFDHQRMNFHIFSPSSYTISHFKISNTQFSLNNISMRENVKGFAMIFIAVVKKRCGIQTFFDNHLCCNSVTRNIFMESGLSGNFAPRGSGWQERWVAGSPELFGLKQDFYFFERGW
jgi:hypothetical protein